MTDINVFEMNDELLNEVLESTAPKMFPAKTEAGFLCEGFLKDRETDSIIKSFTDKTTGEDRFYVQAILTPFGNQPDDNYVNIYHFLSLPYAGTAEDKKRQRVMYDYKAFFQAFGMAPPTSIKEDMMNGKTCRAIVGVKSDKEYGDKNIILNFILPGQNKQKTINSGDSATVF